MSVTLLHCCLSHITKTPVSVNTRDVKKLTESSLRGWSWACGCKREHTPEKFEWISLSKQTNSAWQQVHQRVFQRNNGNNIYHVLCGTTFDSLSYASHASRTFWSHNKLYHFALTHIRICSIYFREGENAIV